jgi:hypothetical protein
MKTSTITGIGVAKRKAFTVGILDHFSGNRDYDCIVTQQRERQCHTGCRSTTLMSAARSWQHDDGIDASSNV